jgi:hypothetical protein
MLEESRTELPTWILAAPSEAPPAPPLATLGQVLPFDELAWEDFERLCCRLVRRAASVIDCRLYGVRGQDQEGIDLFAQRQDSLALEVFQCKRVNAFTSSEIRAAVDLFLEGSWATRATRFVLCTSIELATTKVQEEVLEQRQRLSDAGVAFDVWDGQELSQVLKTYPEIVHDFFGRAWVERFIGSEAALALESRLDAAEVVRLRGQLKALYSAVFRSQDSGSSAPVDADGNPSLDLLDRIVPLDVQLVSRVGNGMGTDSTKSGEVTDVSAALLDQEILRGFDPLGMGDVSMVTRIPARTGESAPEYVPRESLDSWLAAGERAIMVGRPGSGKSSMLRYLALDLLSTSPRLSQVAHRWGQRLPIWIPFAFWTKLIASHAEPPSLVTCIARWLEAYDSADLIPLVEGAIHDQRLLLLVDGLDEWVDEDAARVALQLLQVHVATKGTAALLSARPFALERLPISTEGWRLGELADLSISQQQEIAQRWLRWSLQGGIEADAGEGVVDSKTKLFLDGLGSSSDLRTLGRTPLLFVSLLFLWVERSELPRHRFDAYDRLVEHLLATHPARRKAAAFLGSQTEVLDAISVRAVLAHLAYNIHAGEGQGVVDDEQAVSLIRALLVSDESIGLGMDEPSAATIARGFLPAGTDSLGVLSRPSPKQIAFFHRAIQEFLASVHLNRLSLDEQIAAVSRYGCDARWREVVLGLVWLCQRPTDADALVEALTPEGALQHQYAQQLKAEIAFGNYRLSPATARGLADDAIRLIEVGESFSQRREAMAQVLGGLSNPALRSQVETQVRRWSYRREVWPPSLYQALASWPFDELSRQLLWSGLLLDDDRTSQRVASLSLAAISDGDESMGDQLLHMAARSQLVGRRMAALDSLASGWQSKPELPAIAQSSAASDDNSLAAAGIAAKVHLNMHTEDDLKILLALSNRGRGLNWETQRELAPVLAEGWPHDPELKAKCLEGAKRDTYGDERLDSSVAQWTLVLAFEQDNDVAAWIGDELAREKHPFLLVREPFWRELVRNFRGHPVVTEAIDRWLPGQAFLDIEIAAATQVGRTEVGKIKLLEMLKSSSFPHWPAGALLEGWGMSDSGVQDALLGVANGPADRASRIGHLLPQILGSNARDRLMGLLRDHTVPRKDFLVRGLAGLDDRGDEAEIVGASLAEDENALGYLDELVEGFPDDNRVRQLAETALLSRDSPLAAVAYAYRGDEAMRTRVFEAVSPLPASLRGVLSSHIEKHRDIPTIGSILQNYDNERDSEVKLVAAIGYYSGLTTQAFVEEREDLIRLLHSSGWDYEGRVRVAIAGLLVGGQLTKEFQAKELHDGTKELRIPFEYFSLHSSFSRLIAEHWDELINAFGSNVAMRFGWHESQAGFWTQLARVAIDFPATHKALWHELERDPRLAASPACLRFMAESRGATHELRELCLSVVLGTTVPTIGVQDQSAEDVATDILFEQFPSDEGVVERLSSENPTVFDQDLVACLCRLAPESSAVQALYEEASAANRQPMPGRSYFSLRFALDAPERIPATVEDALQWVLAADRFGSTDVTRAAKWRLQRDGEVRTTMSDALAEPNALPSYKASVPRLLRATGSLGASTRTWCREEIDRQESGACELGLDLVLQKVQGVALSLTDAISGLPT